MTGRPNLERLDAFLFSDDSPETCMMLSDLDGFLHGVTCSPVAIRQDEWMTRALGDAPGNLPKWVVETVAELHRSISYGLATTPPEVNPIFWQASENHVIAMDWCEGFMDAVALRPKQWLRLNESGTHGHLMTPLMIHLINEDGQSVLGIPEEHLAEALDEAAQRIPDSVVGIYEFWKEQKKLEAS